MTRTPALNKRDEQRILEYLDNFEEDPEDPGPEIICLSFGYADLYPDGSVVAYGREVRPADR